MPANTPPESDALAVELRTAAEDMRDIPGGLGYFIELMERAASDRTTTAAERCLTPATNPTAPRSSLRSSPWATSSDS